jgi:hypothetical protein
VPGEGEIGGLLRRDTNLVEPIERPHPDDVRRHARERWKEYRQGLEADGGAGQEQSNEQTKDRGHEQDDDHSM